MNGCVIIQFQTCIPFGQPLHWQAQHTHTNRTQHEATLQPSIHDKVSVVVAGGPMSQVLRATTDNSHGKGDSAERMSLGPAAIVAAAAAPPSSSLSSLSSLRPALPPEFIASVRRRRVLRCKERSQTLYPRRNHIYTIAAPCHRIDIIIIYCTTHYSHTVDQPNDTQYLYNINIVRE